MSDKRFYVQVYPVKHGGEIPPFHRTAWDVADGIDCQDAAHNALHDYQDGQYAVYVSESKNVDVGELIGMYVITKNKTTNVYH